MRFHFEMLGQPDPIADGHFLQFKLGAGLYLRQKTLDRDGMDNFSGNLYPLIRFGIDPELSFHTSENLRFHGGRVVSGLRSSLQEIDFTRLQFASAEKRKIERLG